MKKHWKFLLAALVLCDFAVLSAWAVNHVGYVGIFEHAFASPGGIQLFVDLCVALGLVSIWMIRDARARAVNPVPYLLLTLSLGSIGPLVYFVARARRSQGPSAPVSMARVLPH